MSAATAQGPSTRAAKGRPKILNNEEKKDSQAKIKTIVSTKVPLSANSAPPQNTNSQSIMSIRNASTSNTSPPGRKKNMDHYVLKTIKSENNNNSEKRDGVYEEEDEDDIAFILNDDPVEDEEGSQIVGPSGTITEELHLSADEDDEEGEGKTEEIVEHVCGKCYKSFRRISGLKKHLDFCRFDSGYHLRKAEMLKNLDKIEKDAVVMENKDVCFCCGESYDTFHLGHINCPDCPKSFKTQISYERHIFITHSENDDYPCTVCNAKLRSKKLLDLHIEQHQNRGKPFACKICGKDFTRSYHLKRHQKYSSCSADAADSMSCKVCSKVFYRLDNLRSHLKIHLGTLKTKKSEYMCPICKNCFYSLSTLNIHTRTHTGERPFDCDLCEKKFPSLVALKKHRRYHTGEKPYTCSVCNQSFAVKEVLNRHMKRHTGERPHVCKDCGKSFIQATQLRSHAKTHLRPFPCQICKEAFKTAKQLDRHLKTHNKRGRKSKDKQNSEETVSSSDNVVPAAQFKCKFCDASYKRARQLDNHVSKKHDKNAKRTDCAICNKNFDTPKSLHFHILKVHEVDPENFVNERPQNETSEDIQLPPAKIIKLDDTGISSIEFITPDNADTPVGESTKKRNVASKASPQSSSAAIGTVTDMGNGIVVQEFIVSELDSTTDQKSAGVGGNTYSVIALDNIPAPLSGGAAVANGEEQSDANKMPIESKKVLRRSLAKSLAAAILTDKDDNVKKTETMSKEDLQLKENVGKLLDMLVDKDTLKKFGWPKCNEETVLCKVIENCGHDFSRDAENYKEYDYATRMREYVKLLFTVVIHNDSIKILLNNYPIDEVIEYVLGNDDDDEDDDQSDDGNQDESEDSENERKPDDKTAVEVKKIIALKEEVKDIISDKVAASPT